MAKTKSHLYEKLSIDNMTENRIGFGRTNFLAKSPYKISAQQAN